jgi:outer membrane receptor for ferrienterochelin and colicins
MKFILFVTGLLFLSTKLFSQSASISGIVQSNNEPIIGASIYVHELGRGMRSDNKGEFLISNIKAGSYSIRVSFTGYKTIEQGIELQNNEHRKLNFTLVEEAFSQNEVVVSATRNRINRQDAPVIVNTISNRTFEATQSLSLAEGLSFSPGLRLENNCQNCGFTQLRMNGLDGAYSQILINSRPVFSALAGVYGLEMLPANMVDRIEIVRGGGSVLFGGNAIAGTVNIITKDPLFNSFEVGMNQGFTNAETSDRTLTFNASLVSEDFKKGITFFGFNRERAPWDANGDEFSEITKLRNNTFGFDAFWNVAERSKLKLGLYSINEFRRGGSDFNLAPHQSRTAEQLQHNITSLNASFEHYTKNFKHKFSVYSSAQWVIRDSYYGAGGRIIEAGDSISETDLLAINAYGQSNDISLVSGLQYNYEISKKILFTTGSEFNFNRVSDRMPGYERSINQEVNILGTYAQLEFKPNDKLTFLAGGRFDALNIAGNYQLGNENFNNNKSINVLVPRITAMYSFQKNWKLRASFAQGYRGPQAFDEDLHIETVGGAARFVLLSENLTTERSNSANLSLNYDMTLRGMQFNFVIDGFYTQLNNPFILSNQVELPSGVAVITKRNGSGAQVYGTNLEASIAFTNQWMLQTGFTLQRATYDDEEEIWAPEDVADATAATVTTRLLRTPNNYGYLTLVYAPNKKWSYSYSAVYTGSMDVAHMIDPETERTIIKSTPQFFENNIKISYTLKAKDQYRIQFFAGIQNLFNSYQNNFDIGQNRDAGYVYGPTRPRTFFFGLKFGME